MWKYSEKNISTDNAVAKYTNSNDKCVLEVIECRNYYLARPTKSIYAFIGSFQVPYSLTVDEKAEKGLSTDEVLARRLKIACKLIEEKYKEQVDLILSVIG